MSYDEFALGLGKVMQNGCMALLPVGRSTICIQCMGFKLYNDSSDCILCLISLKCSCSAVICITYHSEKLSKISKFYKKLDIL